MVIKRRGGFTLIEMLVVIAVVGILSATVLTALNPARGKAKDSRVITGMQNLRAIAETKYNGTTGVYQDVSVTAFTNANQLKDIAANGVTISKPENFNADMPQNGKFYRIWVKLPNSQKYYCVDSSGNTKEQDAVPNASGLTCNP